MEWTQGYAGTGLPKSHSIDFPSLMREVGGIYVGSKCVSIMGIVFDA